MNEVLRIRYASAKDAEMLADFSRKTFYESYARFNSAHNMDLFLSREFDRSRLITEVVQHTGEFLVALSNQMTVGYARIRQASTPIALRGWRSIEIARIYVDRVVQGKGVGTELMGRCVQHACDLNMQVIWLGVWERNVQAIEFYKKCGFERFGEHFFTLGNEKQTDWLLRKTL